MSKEKNLHRILEIDTNNENSNKFKSNVKLFDLILPNIKYLIDGDTAYSYDYFNWDRIRESFLNDDVHCMWLKDENTYISAADFQYIIIDCLPFYDNYGYRYVETLSELCDDISEKFNIKSWKVNE